MVIPILAALAIHRTIDWPLFWTSVLFYVIALVLYGLVHFIRAGWLAYQTHEETIIQQKREIDKSSFTMQQKEEEHGHRETQNAQAISTLQESSRQLIDQLSASERSVYELKTELAKERELATQPDIALIWNWPEDQRMFHTLHGDTEKEILVHNRSKQFVYNVQIEPVPLRNGLRFDLITELPPAAEYKTIGRWEDKSNLVTNYAYFFIGASDEAEAKGWLVKKEHNRGLSDSYFKIPMVVVYESAGIKWQSEFDFIYDVGQEPTYFVKKSGKRIN